MKWMSMREFLRGGYRDLDEPTVVSNHGRPAFTVFPQDDWTEKRSRQIASIMTTDQSSTFTTNSTTVRSDLPEEDEL